MTLRMTLAAHRMTNDGVRPDSSCVIAARSAQSCGIAQRRELSSVLELK